LTPHKEQRTYPVSVTYVKFCPVCQTSTALDTAVCAHCDHQYRSHLVAPISEKTIAMTAENAPPSLPARVPSVPPASKPRVHVPRPLLVLVSGLALVAMLAGLFIHRLVSSRLAVRDGASLMSVPDSPPYDAVFQSLPGQPMVPVATRKAGDLQRWMHLQRQAEIASATSGEPSDYPETVHLYFSRRILLIASGTHARVLAEHGSWRRVRILGGLHRGTTGYAPSQSLLRVGLSASGSPKQTLTIP